MYGHTLVLLFISTADASDFTPGIERLGFGQGRSNIHSELPRANKGAESYPAPPELTDPNTCRLHFCHPAFSVH